MVLLEILLVVVMLNVETCISFKVSSNSFGPVAADEGGAFNLSCSADNYYEYCSFTSPMGEICNFEWRRREWNITMKACEALARDVTFIGRFLVYTPTTTTTTTSTRAPRTGKELDLNDLNEAFDDDSDITLDVSLIDRDLDDKVSNKVLTKMFSSNIISGGVALIVMIIFLAIFAYIVHRHRSQNRETDIESKNLPENCDKKSSTLVRKTEVRTDMKPSGLTKNPVSSVPDRVLEPRIQWGSPQLRKKIPLSPPSMVSTCSSARSSRRTSLTSIVPSIIEDDNKMDKSDIEFMMKIMPHLITLSPDEIYYHDLEFEEEIARKLQLVDSKTPKLQ